MVDWQKRAERAERILRGARFVSYEGWGFDDEDDLLALALELHWDDFLKEARREGLLPPEPAPRHHDWTDRGLCRRCGADRNSPQQLRPCGPRR